MIVILFDLVSFMQYVNGVCVKYNFEIDFLDPAYNFKYKLKAGCVVYFYILHI